MDDERRANDANWVNGVNALNDHWLSLVINVDVLGDRCVWQRCARVFDPRGGQGVFWPKFSDFS